MAHRMRPDDRVGLVHPATDAHTLGLAAVADLLADCGTPAVLAGRAVCSAFEEAAAGRGFAGLEEWIRAEGITVLGFSYRLDPTDGERHAVGLVRHLSERRLLAQQGGPLRALFAAGLPETCERIARAVPRVDAVFSGDETPAETLTKLGLDASLLPVGLSAGLAYDEARLAFGRELLRTNAAASVAPVARGYPGYGRRGDRLEARLAHGRLAGLPPLMRAHVGPYSGNPAEDFRLFLEWTRRLAAGGLLDVLSIGSSQLTQSHFYTDRTGLPDGGGVSIARPEDFAAVWEMARPMLVRTYAGTRDLERLAAMYDDRLDMAWHTLSFWWFNRLDGRGPNSLAESLAEHFRVLRQVAAAGRPFEANVPHHFAFRGADDVSYVVSGFLAARAAKRAGIRTYVLQVMLNTPKSTWGIQDLAKAQALTRLVRGLEDEHFRVALQPRGGLDYFAADPDRARAQLAAVTALMDDIEPGSLTSPEIIHVVSYSEAVRLADPAVVEESIRITRQALVEWRRLKACGQVADMAFEPDLARRRERLIADAQLVLAAIDAEIPHPDSAEGFHAIFAAGFLPVPWLWEGRDDYPRAVSWRTRSVDGGISVVDDEGRPMPTAARIEALRCRLREDRHG